MNRAKPKYFLGYFVMVCLFLSGMASTAEVSQVISPAQELNLGAVPLPRGAVELKKEFRFPRDNDQEKAFFLAQPSGMALAPSGHIYISDAQNNEIYAFDLAGKHTTTFGRTGQGPGDFLTPTAIAISDGTIFVREAHNLRIQLFDLFGKYKSNFKVYKGYISFAAANGHVYAAPMQPPKGLAPKEASLIDVLDYNGRVLQSFGDLLDVNGDTFPFLNLAFLAPGFQNELWVAFNCFPIVRKYSMDGKLIAEYHYRYGVGDKKEAYNKQPGAERTPPLYFINYAVYVSRRGLYLIDSGAGSKFLILFIGQDGRVSECYWAPIEKEGFFCSGLLVIEERFEKKFYVLNSSEACVDVYSAQASKADVLASSPAGVLRGK